MPVMNGKDLDVFIETATPGTFIAVNDMNTFGKSVTKSVDRFPVFMRGTPYAVPGAREATYTMEGYLNTDDPGQLRLFALEAGDLAGKIKVMFDGTNGFSQEVKVSSYSYDAEPEGLQEI